MGRGTTIYLEDWILENMQNLGWTGNRMEKAKILIAIANKNLSRAFKSGVKVALAPSPVSTSEA